MLVPTNEEASKARCRCPSRDPTCPYTPNTTHASSRTQCPRERAFARPKAMSRHPKSKASTRTPKHAPLDAKETEKGTDVLQRAPATRQRFIRVLPGPPSHLRDCGSRRHYRRPHGHRTTVACTYHAAWQLIIPPTRTQTIGVSKPIPRRPRTNPRKGQTCPNRHRRRDGISFGCFPGHRVALARRGRRSTPDPFSGIGRPQQRLPSSGNP